MWTWDVMWELHNVSLCSLEPWLDPGDSQTHPECCSQASCGRRAFPAHQTPDRFLSPGTFVTSGRLVLCYGGCPVHSRTFMPILASTHSMTVAFPAPQCDNPKCLHTLLNTPGDKITPSREPLLTPKWCLLTIGSMGKINNDNKMRALGK